MFKNKKKFMIPVLVIMLLVAMAGTALADQSSSYSMIIPYNGELAENNTHIYGDGDNNYFYDKNTSATDDYKSYLVNATTGYSATLTLYMWSGHEGTRYIYREQRNNSDMYRIHALDYDYLGPITINGRYGMY